jgi:general secretion pathway protein A
VYLEFYGLKEPPFSITPNPRYLFYSAKHREALNHLLYGIRERKGFVQLTGEVGTGKTTLCRAMLDQLGRNFATARRIFSYMQGVPRLANALCDKCLLAGFVKEADRINHSIACRAVRELEGEIHV